MGPLVLLGFRLTRAGGWFRFGCVAIGCALGVVLGTLAWDLPAALAEPTEPEYGVFAGMLAVIGAPVIILIAAVTRLSSEVRDRRLSALRLLGVGRARVLSIGLVEILAPATIGTLSGVLAYLAVAQAVNALVADIVRPLAANAHLALIGASVMCIAAAMAIAPLRRLGQSRAGASEAAAPAPSLWRLSPLPIAIGLFAAVDLTPPSQFTTRTGLALIGGVLAAAVAVVSITPLVISWAARRLVSGSGVAQTLAGRAIGSQGASISRRVTAFGATGFIAFVALGYVGLLESDPYTQSVIRQMERGPQEIMVASEEPIPSDVLQNIRAIDGVEGLYSTTSLHLPGEDYVRGPVFIGSCAELALVASTTGCDDNSTAWITRVNIPRELEGWYGDDTAFEGPVELSLGDEVYVPIEVDGEIVWDVSASTERWADPHEFLMFVPSAQAAALGISEPSGVRVIAEVGDQVREEVIAAARSVDPWAFSTAEMDYPRIVSIRIATWTVLGTSVVIALGVFAVASIDRARSGRRTRARFVALGVPASVLRRSEALTMALPLAVSMVLAFSLSSCAVLVFARGVDMAVPTESLAVLVAVSILASGAVALTTIPLTRSHVRAEDLRQE